MSVKVGGLKVSTSATPATQSVIIGQQDFTFANYVLDASDSGEDIKVTQMAVVHKTAANSTQTNIANLQMFDGSTALDPIVQPSAVAATSATSTFTFTNPVIVKKGTSKTLTLKGSVNTGTGGTDTHAFGCNSSSCVTAAGAETSNSITASVTNSDGQTMSLVGSGSLTVADDASNPQAKLLIAGSSKQTVGELRLTATNEDLSLTDIHFTASALNSGSLTAEVSKLYLYNGSTEIASLVPTTSAAATFIIPTNSFVIPKGSAGIKLTIKADMAGIGSGLPGNSGRGFNLAVDADAYGAKGMASGSPVSAANKSGTFTGKQFTVFKSLPIVTVQNIASTSLVNGNGVELFKFKLAADSNGDIGFYKATFDVATSVATVTDYKFREYNDDGSTGEVDLTANSVRQVDETITASTFDAGRGGTHRLNVLFDTDSSGGNSGVANGGEYRLIGAGQAKVYKFSANVANSTSGSTVSTVMVGDGAFPSTYPMCAGTTTGNNACTGIDSAVNDSFIWSDLNVGNNSTTATNTAEWANGYRLFSTTTSQTLTR
jgi:hypothetical protein